jgi:hypothetical protein
MRSGQGKWILVFFASLALLSGALLLGADKKPKVKHAVVEIQELKVTVDGPHVNIDGKLRNAGERQIEKLVLSFHFFDPDHKPVTTLHMDVDPDTLDPDDDTEIHAAANTPPRAVSVEVTAEDRGEHELTVVKAGPYLIDD